MTKTPLQRIEEFLDKERPGLGNNMERIAYYFIDRSAQLEAALKYAVEHTDKTNPYFFMEIANILDGDGK